MRAMCSSNLSDEKAAPCLGRLLRAASAANHAQAPASNIALRGNLYAKVHLGVATIEDPPSSLSLGIGVLILAKWQEPVFLFLECFYYFSATVRGTA